MSIDFILQLDILALLTTYLYNPLIYDIILNIISPNSSRFVIDEAYQAKIWIYCFKGRLFFDLEAQMLRGAEIPQWNYSKIDISKWEFPTKYEKNIKNAFISQESAKVDLDKLLGKTSELCSVIFLYFSKYIFIFILICVNINNDLILINFMDYSFSN